MTEKFRFNTRLILSGYIPSVAAVGLAFFLLYFLTSADVWELPSFFAMDGAEYLIVSQNLGIDHPPGHPLYLIFGSLFSRLPFDHPDKTLIFMSSFWGAAAIALLYASIFFLTGKRLAALISSCMMGLSYLFWLHSAIIEVYTLQSCVQILFLFFGVLLARSGNYRYALALSFSLGLISSINPILAGLLIPVYIIFLIIGDFFKQGKLELWKSVLPALGCLLLGALPLLYLPIRIYFKTGYINDIALMSPYDLGSFRWYIWYFSAWVFTGNKIATQGLSGYPGLLFNYFKSVFVNLGPLALIFILLGIKETFRFAKTFRPAVQGRPERKKKKKIILPAGLRKDFFISAALLTGFLVTMVPVLDYTVVDKEVFYLPSMIFLVYISAVGINMLSPIKSKWPIILCGACVILYGFISNIKEVTSLTKETGLFRERLTRFLMIPPGSTILGYDDGITNKYAYFQKVMSLRKDLAIETIARYSYRKFNDGNTGSEDKSSRVILEFMEKTGNKNLYILPVTGQLPTPVKGYKAHRASFDPTFIFYVKSNEIIETAVPVPADVMVTGNPYPGNIQIVGWSIRGTEGGTGSRPGGSVAGKGNHDAVVRVNEIFDFQLVTRNISNDGSIYLAEIIFTDKNGTVVEEKNAGYRSVFQMLVMDRGTPSGYYRNNTSQFKLLTHPQGENMLFMRLLKAGKEAAVDHQGKKTHRIEPVPGLDKNGRKSDFIFLGSFRVM